MTYRIKVKIKHKMQIYKIWKNMQIYENFYEKRK